MLAIYYTIFRVAPRNPLVSWLYVIVALFFSALSTSTVNVCAVYDGGMTVLTMPVEVEASQLSAFHVPGVGDRMLKPLYLAPGFLFFLCSCIGVLT